MNARRKPVVEGPDAAMVEIWRSKSPAERLAVAFGMWRSARELIRSLLRAEHPEWDDAQIDRETARRLAHGDR